MMTEQTEGAATAQAEQDPARPVGLIGWIREEWAMRPRPSQERQPCAAELIEYAQYGIWTTKREGWQRSAHLAYMRWFARPVIVVCDDIKHVVSRPERMLAVMVVAVLIALGILLMFLIGW